MKTFILDTNILLHDPYSPFKFGANKVVIPAIVLDEVDSKKRLQDEIGRNARAVSREIDKLREQYPTKLNQGIELENGGIIQIELNHISYERMEHVFHEKTPDNRILAVALNLKVEEEEFAIKKAKEPNQIIMVSNDILMRVKADALGIVAEKYDNDRLIDNSDEAHKGYHHINVSKNIINEYYKNKQLDYAKIEPYITTTVYVQDFFILKDENGGSSSALAKLVKKDGKLMLTELFTEKMDPIWGIKGRNAQQKMLMELLMDKDVELVLATGKAGTGKTLLSLAAGLSQTLDEEDYKKVLVARPIVSMGKDLGALPGELEDKLRPWMQPIYDNLEFLFNTKDDKELTGIMDGMKGKLKVEALSYIRGRSIPQQFLLIDESQNLSHLEIKTILTRAGKDTKIILIGDPDQIDAPYLDSTNNGLVYAIERMKQEENVGVINLEKTERSGLADRAADLL